MFKNLTDFGYKRSTKEAIGFYIAYFVLILLGVAALSYGLKLIFAVVALVGLSLLILRKKNLMKHIGYILLSLVSGTLVYLGGALLGLILGLIPVAYLSTIQQLSGDKFHQPIQKKTSKWLVVGLVVITLVTLGFVEYRSKTTLKPRPQPAEAPKTQSPTIISTNYSAFQEDITDNLNIDLKQIKYFNGSGLSEEEKQSLSKFGFAVESRKSGYDEFFDLYETNKTWYNSNFITIDSVLHLLHKHFEYLTKRSEENIYLPLLENVINSGLSQAKTRYENNPNSNYHKISYLYFLVGAKLLNLNVNIPPNLEAYLNQELALINNGNQLTPSIILNLDKPDENNLVKIDYSQFAVRGYYTENDNLKRYFKGYMWLSLPAINLKSERGMALSQNLTEILLGNQQAVDSYNKIRSFVIFFTNIASNVSFDDMKKFNINSGNNLSSNLEKLLKNKNNPLVNDDNYLKFSFFPRASLLDNYIFENDEKKKIARLFPSTIEVPAVYGSAEAKNIAKKIGFAEIYNNNEYLASLESLKNAIVGKQDSLYSQWMMTINPLLNYPDNKYIFSSTRAWLRKELVTYLGSWTELRHSMVLYAESTGAGGGGEPEKRDDRGLVEPYPKVYQGINSNIDYILKHFQKNDLLDAKASQDLKSLQAFVQRIAEIALKEINQQALSDADYDFIRDYGYEYEKLWLNTFTEEQKAKSDLIGLTAQNPAALIADVHADENGQILHTGNGFPQRIKVIFKLDGEMRTATGLVYSNYEFRQQNKRLTDEEWRKILRSRSGSEDYTDVQLTPWQKIYQFPIVYSNN